MNYWHSNLINPKKKKNPQLGRPAGFHLCPPHHLCQRRGPEVPYRNGPPPPPQAFSTRSPSSPSPSSLPPPSSAARLTTATPVSPTLSASPPPCTAAPPRHRIPGLCSTPSISSSNGGAAMYLGRPRHAEGDRVQDLEVR